MNRPTQKWFCADFAQLDYKEAWGLQLSLLAARKSGSVSKDTLLLLEHPSVFTLGRHAGLENLTVSKAFIQARNIPLFQVERGGDITFHGPGQLIGYPVMDLSASQLGVEDYVNLLEEVMIRTAAHWGVRAHRSPKNPGIWKGNRKMGSVGIAIRQGITFHGFAFYVNSSLEPFNWINPCGLKDTAITSLANEISGDVSIDDAREELKRNFKSVFQAQLTSIDALSLNTLLANGGTGDIQIRTTDVLEPIQ